jgi:uncharacterized protein with HEPN domain
MSRDPELRLEDILDSINWIEAYIADYDYEAFKADRKTIDAVTRCLEIIGEAAKHVRMTTQVNGTHHEVVPAQSDHLWFYQN